MARMDADFLDQQLYDFLLLLECQFFQ